MSKLAFVAACTHPGLTLFDDHPHVVGLLVRHVVLPTINLLRSSQSVVGGSDPLCLMGVAACSTVGCASKDENHRRLNLC